MTSFSLDPVHEQAHLHMKYGSGAHHTALKGFALEYEDCDTVCVLD